jgi:putative resolvase
LSDPDVTHVIVERRDRLMCFGKRFLEAALSAKGTQLMIVDDSELKDGLVQDMIATLTSFCSRLYGRRSSKNLAKKLVEDEQDGRARKTSMRAGKTVRPAA